MQYVFVLERKGAMDIQNPAVLTLSVIMSIATVWTFSTAIRVHDWKYHHAEFPDGLIHGREATPISIGNIARTANLVILLQAAITVWFIIVGAYLASPTVEDTVAIVIGVVVFAIITLLWLYEWYSLQKDVAAHKRRRPSS